MEDFVRDIHTDARINAAPIPDFHLHRGMEIDFAFGELLIPFPALFHIGKIATFDNVGRRLAARGV